MTECMRDSAEAFPDFWNILHRRGPDLAKVFQCRSCDSASLDLVCTSRGSTMTTISTECFHVGTLSGDGSKHDAAKPCVEVRAHPHHFNPWRWETCFERGVDRKTQFLKLVPCGVGWIQLAFYRSSFREGGAVFLLLSFVQMSGSCDALRLHETSSRVPVTWWLHVSTRAPGRERANHKIENKNMTDNDIGR